MYKKIVGETFNGILKKKHELLKALLIPFLLIVSIDITSINFLQDGNKFFYIVLALILFAINILVSITTHRILLINENAVPTWGLYKFGKREFKFLIYTFLIIILISIVLTLIILGLSVFVNSNSALFMPLTVAFSVILGIFLFVRLSLVLPAIALDQELSFLDSWNITSKYKILCMLTIVIIPSIVASIISFVYGIAIEFLTAVISTKLSFLNSLLTLFVNVFIISALSATYKYLVHEDYLEKEEVSVTQSKEIKTSSKDDTFDIFLPFSFGLEFDEIKAILYEEYSRFGFDKVITDKDNSWMIKTTREGQSYVSVSVLEDSFKIESFNTQKPDIEIFKNKDEKL